MPHCATIFGVRMSALVVFAFASVGSGWGLFACTSRASGRLANVQNAPMPVALPHETCRALGTAGQGRAFDECAKMIGQAQTFGHHGLPLCLDVAKRVALSPRSGMPREDRSILLANEAVDCIRGLSNTVLSAESALSCTPSNTGVTPSKDAEGRCLSGALDPFDCLEPVGRCLRVSADRVAVEDSVPAAKALASLESFRDAVLRNDSASALTLVEAIGSADGGALESRPPLSDLSGVPSGYAPGDVPLALPEPLSKAVAPGDPLRARAFYLAREAVDFCDKVAPTEDCARAVVNFEFSAADLALCQESAAQGQGVACLYAVRQVHKKGHVRRSKLQADALTTLGQLQAGHTAKAKASLESLWQRLESLRAEDSGDLKPRRL